MAFRLRGENKRYVGRGVGFRGRGFQAISHRFQRGRGPRKESVKINPDRSQHDDHYSRNPATGASHFRDNNLNDRGRHKRGTRRQYSAPDNSLLDDNGIDFHEMEEGLRITVENKGADICVADPSFYEEIQRHIMHSQDQSSHSSDLHYEDVSDSADSDQASSKKTGTVRQSCRSTLSDSGMYNDFLQDLHHSCSRSPSRGRKTAGRLSKKRQRSGSSERSMSYSHQKSRMSSPRRSKSRSHVHTRSKSPGHTKGHRRTRSRSRRRTRSRSRENSIRALSPKKHFFSKQRSRSHRHTRSRSRGRTRSRSRRRTRSRSCRRTRSRSRRRTRSRSRRRTRSRSRRRTRSRSRRRTRSRSSENNIRCTSPKKHLFNEQVDNLPPWITDPSKAMSVEEIEKYLESKLKQAELQTQTGLECVLDQHRGQETDMASTGASLVESSNLKQLDDFSIGPTLKSSHAIKESSPLDLYDDLPEQPRLATPPKILPTKAFKSILKKKTAEPVKEDKTPSEEIKNTCVSSSADAITESKPNILIPGLASAVDIEDEDQFLYGSVEALDPIGDQQVEEPSTGGSEFEPVFTGGYSKNDPGWEVAPAKVWSEAIEEQPPQDEKKKEAVKIDPTIQNILKSIGFNFELSKLMQQKAQTQRKGEEGSPSSVECASNSKTNSASNSSDKLPAKKGRYNRTSSTEVKESYEERARRYREEQMKMYQFTKTESAPEYTDESSRQSQDSYSSNQMLSVSSQLDSMKCDHLLYDRLVHKEQEECRSGLLHMMEHGEGAGIHMKKMSGLQQLQNDYCLKEGHSFLGNDADMRESMKTSDRHECEQTQMDSVSSISCGKRSDASVRDRMHSHERITRSSDNRKKDDKHEKGRDKSHRKSSHDDDGSTRFQKQGEIKKHEDISISRRIVLLPNEKKTSAPREVKTKEDVSESHCKTPESSGDSTKRLLAMNTEDKEDLMIELEKWQNRLNLLEKELVRLRREENEMMRRQQRQKKWDCNSLLKDNVGLQDDIKTQMMLLSRAAEINTKLLLSGKSGDRTNIVDYLNRIKEKIGNREDRTTKKVLDPSPEIIKKKLSSSEKKTDSKMLSEVKSESGKTTEKKSSDVGKKKRKIVQYEYFDPGDHWCKQCNCIFGKCETFFQHLHSANHVNKLERPWLPQALKNSQKSSGKGKGMAVPLRGVEFLVPAQAFYCILCKEFSGDLVCAEDHLKSQPHNENYQSFVDDNHFYETHYNQEKEASCPSMIDALKHSESTVNMDDHPAMKNVLKLAHKNPLVGKKYRQLAVENQKEIREEKVERKKNEEHVVQKDVSTVIKGGPKPVNFKWKGKMPIIGKSPAYRKAASAAKATECDDKKVLFTVRNKSPTRVKSQSAGCQNSDTQLIKERAITARDKNQEERDPQVIDMFADSVNDKDDQTMTVDLKDIALPPMPPSAIRYAPKAKLVSDEDLKNVEVSDGKSSETLKCSDPSDEHISEVQKDGNVPVSEIHKNEKVPVSEVQKDEKVPVSLSEVQKDEKVPASEIPKDEKVPVSLLQVQKDEKVPVSLSEVQKNEKVPVSLLQVQKDEKVPVSEVQKDEKVPVSEVQKDEKAPLSEVQKDEKVSVSEVQKDEKVSVSEAQKDEKVSVSEVQKDEEVTVYEEVSALKDLSEDLSSVASCPSVSVDDSVDVEIKHNDQIENDADQSCVEKITRL